MTEKDLLIQDLKFQNEKLKEELNGKWIRCSERMPDEKLIQFMKHDVTISPMVFITYEDEDGRRLVDRDKTMNGVWDYHRDEKVVAWQPLLPSAYMGDE